MRLIDRSKLEMDVKKWLKAPCPPDDSIMVALDDIAVSVLMTIEEQPLVKAVPLDKVKQARKETQKLVDMCGSDTLAELDKKAALQAALLSIDVLITESEGEND